MTDVEKIRASAEMVVREMGPLSNLRADFGYNRESVAWVEGYIERMRNSGKFTDEMALANLSSVIGAFLGECVARNYGGEWRCYDGRWGVYFANGSAAFPGAKVMKQFQRGLEGGDSILGFYDLIEKVLLKPPSS